ncbi:MAG TPA: aminotransferase class IV [Chitinophagaceae bacterium]
MKKYYNYNGRFFSEDQRVLSPDDRSYRYGDGLFETMKIAGGKILLEEYHFERLFSGLQILKFEVPAQFTKQKMSEQIGELCKKNCCEESARVRLSVSRGSGGLFDCDNKLNYLIESSPLDPIGLNENGLIIDIFPDVRKGIDILSNLKSANYLPYVMAAIWAKENRLNEALILNQHGRICDATIANVFWIKGGQVFTPPLNEGCVGGVMRKNILNTNNQIQEKRLTENELATADEVFLTNATNGIRWVQRFRDKSYENKITRYLFTQIVQTISP